MILIPCEKQTIVSSLNPETVQARLSAFVDTHLKWYQRHSDKSFRGKISAGQFRIYRNILGRNSYLPLIKGRLEPTTSGTKINLHFYIHPIVTVALLTFLIGVEAIAISKAGSFNFFLMAVFIGFHCFMYLIGYLPEKRKAQQFLCERLHAANA